MEAVRYSLLLIFAAFAVNVVVTDPLQRANDHGDFMTFRGTIFSSFDEMRGFIHHWFSKLRNRLLNGAEENGVDPQSLNSHPIQKRNVHLPTGFEEYELYYLRTAIIPDLKTFFSFAKDLQGTNSTARDSLDEMLHNEEERVKRMSLDELKRYTQALKRALQSGISSSNTLVINGQVYDMNHVGSWCCPF